MKALTTIALLFGCSIALAEPSQPNILFIEVDDLTYKYVGAFGASEIRTPNIDKLALRGVLFENAIVQGCMCAPSRNSLITARYPHNLGLYSNGDIKQMPATTWAFPRALQEAGLYTSWIGKSHLLPFTDDQQGRGGDKKTGAMLARMGFDEVWQSAGRHVALKRATELAAAPDAKWKRGVDAYADYLHDKGLLDLAKTALDLTRSPAKAQSDAFGESLVPLLRDDDARYQREFAIAEIRDATAMVTDRYKYIETKQGDVLFDLIHDPDELTNAAPSNPQLCEEFRSKLALWRDKTK